MTPGVRLLLVVNPAAPAAPDIVPSLEAITLIQNSNDVVRVEWDAGAVDPGFVIRAETNLNDGGWTENGSAAFVGDETADVFLGSPFAVGDVIKVRIYVVDGEDESEPTESSALTACVAFFTTDPDSGSEPLNLILTNLSSGAAVGEDQYSWEEEVDAGDFIAFDTTDSPPVRRLSAGQYRYQVYVNAPGGEYVAFYQSPVTVEVTGG